MRKIIFSFLIIVIVIISFSLISLYIRTHKKKSPTIEGILRAPCGGIGGPYVCSATPSIKYQHKECDMNLYLETEGSKKLWDDPDNIRTSFCFFETKFNEEEFKNKFLDKKVTILGSMENATVCMLLKKCPEPECSKCSDEKVLIPIEIR